jgi:ABC-type nitrate/sulfonate/bicarbonate transport system permease component
MYLAAGESMLAIYNGTAFHVSYILGALVGTLIGVVMWRSEVFSRATASMAILANVISLGLYVPVVGLYISIFSVLFLEIFYILVARRFFQIGRQSGQLILQPA